MRAASPSHVGRRSAAKLAYGFTTLGLVLAATAGGLHVRAEHGNPTAVQLGMLRSRTFEFEYSMSLPSLPATARRVSVWIPLPRETAAQHVEEMNIETNLSKKVVSDPVYGNRFLYLETDGGLPERPSVALQFTIRRDGYGVRDPVASLSRTDQGVGFERFLQSDKLVPTSGVVAERSARVLSGFEGRSFQKARLLYEEVLRTMRYDKSGVGWGQGDAVYACEVGAGNCTDFHSLFIGMSRAAGIPARFVMGVPLPPARGEGQIPGYHCWAEFYDGEVGWVPLDASEAWKHPEMRELLFAGLDPNRVEFTIGRDIPLVPEDRAAGEVLNYSVYPYVMIDGLPYDGFVTSFRFRDVES